MSPLSQTRNFHQLVNDLGLMELNMGSSQFTRWNKRMGSASIRSKLDRSFGNLAFGQLEINDCISAVPMSSLDHHALLFHPIKEARLDNSRRRPVRLSLGGYPIRNVTVLSKKIGVCRVILHRYKF